MLLSIITPCYNEEEALPYFLKAIRMESEKLLMELGLEIEIIFVDDGSRDRTMELLRAAAKEDRRVRYISFSRNFGKESAMYAGMEDALGECAVIMDADLQHPPVMLEEMYRAITEEGYDIAAARRVSRKGEPPVRSLFARLFYKLINKISKAEFVDGASDFRMLSRPAVDALLRLGEYNRFSKGIFGWGNTTAFPKVFSAGSASKQNGFPMRTWSGSRGKPPGPFGSYCSIPWTAS